MKEMRQFLSVLAFGTCTLFFVLPQASWAVEVATSLRGSPNSMLRQHQIARDLGLEFVREAEEVDTLVEDGVLVPVEGDANYVVHGGVSYPYARPEVRLFIERLAKQYREATGERLVVTSLMRPTSEQPRNSHDLSVHPTGIAIDLRMSSQRRSRAWLENVLLMLEGRKVLDVTRERWPPHYHVALFPEAYATYLEGMIGKEAVAEALTFEKKEAPVPVMEVSSLPGVTVVATATGQDTPLWMFILGTGSMMVLLFSALAFKDQLIERRWKGTLRA